MTDAANKIETAAAVCPHCGFDLVRDAPISSGGFRVDPSGDATWRGERIPLPRSEREILYSLAKSYPRSLSRATLLDRLGSEAEEKTVDQWISKLRSRLREAGAPCPVRTVYTQGYCWEVRA
jgi:DNA-binding response OmpR family regulator